MLDNGFRHAILTTLDEQTENKVIEKMTVGSWEEFIKDLPKLREDQLKQLINYEISTSRRQSFVERMHQRYCKLRMQRERKELMSGGLL